MHRVAAVRDQRAKVLFFQMAAQCVHVFRDNRLCLAAPRIAGEPGERVPAESGHGLAHCFIAVFYGEVASDVYHGFWSRCLCCRAPALVGGGVALTSFYAYFWMIHFSLT